jgi:hypothetical protein
MTFETEPVTAHRRTIDALIETTNGVLRLDPAWVARDWLPPGRRLGLPAEAYDVGERGFICERWLGSTTHADNRIGPADEGLSYLVDDHGKRLTLDDAVSAAPDLVMGTDYAAAHSGLGRLPKIYDFSARIPYHIHPRIEHSILKHSRGFINVPGEGFHLPSGILHAPGTALTIEIQEASDCLSIFQALNAGKIVSKELLFKDVSAVDRAKYGERYLLEWVDWEANGDPFFYENHHLSPQSVVDEPGVREDWIYYGSTKFSGKRLVLAPGARHTAQERGVYSMFVWQGTGTVDGHEVTGGQPGQDELLIIHDRAVRPHDIVNTGQHDLEIITFFGPDINPHVPTISQISS